MHTIYAKTPKGQQEVEHRSASLSLRARRLLILLDGKRSRKEVATMVADSEFDQTLSLLVEQGFAEPRAGEATAPQAAAAAPAAAPAPAQDDPARVEMARNFMLNSLMALYGPHEKLSLKTSIQQSRRTEELRHLYEDWLHSVTALRAGRARADELKEKLLAVL